MLRIIKKVSAPLTITSCGGYTPGVAFIMRAFRQLPFREWGFVALLAALCAGLTWLQYRWTGEISRAEAERLRSGVQDAAMAFAKSFDDTLTAYCSALVPAEGEVNVANRAGVHSQLFKKWQALHPLPIFRRVAVITSSPGGATLLEQNLSDGSLSPAAWPAAWEQLRRHFVQGGRGPFMGGAGVQFEIPVFGGGPREFDGPREFGDPHEFGDPPEREWVAFELDTNYLQTVWLPELAVAHLNFSGKALSAAVIRTIATPPATIYATSATMDKSQKPVLARLNQRGRGAAGARGPMAGEAWLLEVFPQPDALEKLVARSRRKNFAVALGLNGLIFAAGLALVQQTRRSRRLAEQQLHFVAGVSHELRTPLTVIRGAAHNLKRGVVTEREQVENYSGLIIEHVEQLGEMIEQVLALAGVQKKHSPTLRQTVALADVLREAVAATAHDTQAAHCEVSLELPPALPEMSGDVSALRRAFQNLIANAARHGGSGKWIGIIAVADEDSHPPMIEVQVADRGPGIPAHEQGDIFKPFFRGSHAHALQVRGSGLGLSLVKEIIEAHGGSISIHSANGHGATFTVRLPVTKTESTA